MRAIRRCPLAVLARLLLAALAVASVALPDRTYSDLENRPLAEAPQWDAGAYLSGQAMRRWDTYVDDHLALRDEFMMLNAVKDAALLRTQRQGVLLMADGRMAEVADNLTPGAFPANIRAMQTLGENVNLPVTLLMIPLPTQVYTDALPPYYPHTDVQALVQEPLAQTTVNVVDALPALAAAQGETYYRTDHHLTALGAQVALQPLWDRWGMLPSEPDNTLTAPDFYGSFYSRAPAPWIAPDTLTFSLYEGLTLAVSDHEVTGLYDAALLLRRNKYAALLYNNPPELTLTNPNGHGTLLVLRDSYASAMLPALSARHERVIAVDPRFYNGDLMALCQNMQVERILCLYGINALLTDRNLPRLVSAL